MKASRKTKRALIPSILAVIMCVAMLIGTTFAWFTDTASTSVNKIEAGKLDVELQMATTDADGNETWVDAEGETLSWKQANASGSGLVDGKSILWEPGCTYELQPIRIRNNGNLALKYRIEITGIQGSAKLNEAITWTISDTALDSDHSLAAGATSEDLTIKGTMSTGAGNEYQGLTIDSIAITVLATQDAVEYDSSTNKYDENAQYSEYVAPVSAEATGNLTVNQTSADAKATVATEQVISDSVMSVTYPAGVILNTTTVSDDGTTKKASVSQSLKYVGTVAKGAGVTVNTSQSVASYELTLPLDDSNQTLVSVTINFTKGLKNVVVYHSGKQLGPSASDATNTDGEYFAYNSADGKLVLHLMHASPIDIVYDKPDSGIDGDKLVSAWELQNIPSIYDAATETLTIPEGIKSIGSYVLCEGGISSGNRLHVKKLVLPASLETIGNEAFYGGNEIEEIVWLENSKIKSIEDGAFNSCLALKKVTLPTGNIDYANSGLRNCTDLKVTIAEGSESISERAFFGWTNLKEVTLASSLTSVDANAFDGCTSLERVTLAAGNTAYGTNVFASCTSLTEVIIPEGCTSIGQEMFKNCTGLTEVTLPKTITSVGKNAFYGCSNLKAVTLPTGNISYNDSWLKNCTDLEVTIAEGSTTIAEGMFNGWDKLKKVTLPSSLTSVGEKAFLKNTSLKEVTLPDSLESVGDQAFDGCTSLEKVTLAAGNTTYGEKVFSGCEALKEVVIPGGCTSIGTYMFKGCTALTEVILPSSVTSVGDQAFNSCKALKKVTLPTNGISSYANSGLKGCTDLKVTIAEGSTTISEKMFNGWGNLKEVTLPSSLTSVGAQAFDGCTSLEKVTLAAGSTTYGEKVFSGCTSLTTVVIPNGCKSIGTYMFKGCTALTEVILPSSVTSVGDEAFNGCSALKKVTLPTDGISSYANSGLKGCTNLEVTIAEGSTTISEKMFNGWGNLKEVTLASTLASVGDQAFDTCISLEKVTLAAGATTYGDKVFSGCTALKTVVIPNGCENIGTNMFKGCKALTEVAFPSTLKTVGDNAFNNLEGLTKVTLAAGNTTYGTSVFASCSKLTEVVIPNGCTKIGSSMFKSCTSLTSIGTLPNSLTTIGEDAFKGDTGLNDKVFIPATVTTIGNNAFRDITGIRCAAESQPTGWDNNWNNKLKTVTWGVTATA